jgi:hypothetical protein
MRQEPRLRPHRGAPSAQRGAALRLCTLQCARVWRTLRKARTNTVTPRHNTPSRPTGHSNTTQPPTTLTQLGNDASIPSLITLPFRPTAASILIDLRSDLRPFRPFHLASCLADRPPSPSDTQRLPPVRQPVFKGLDADAIESACKPTTSNSVQSATYSDDNERAPSMNGSTRTDACGWAACARRLAL